MGRKSEVLRDALSEYLSNHAIAKAPPIIEKNPKKEKSALEGPEPRGSNRSGPLPLEVRDPVKAKEILDYYGGGESRGGHSRRETAEKFGVGEGQVSHMWARRELGPKD